MSGFSEADLSDEAKAEIRSIPSMIYFGVPTVEAVIMRNLGIPRSLSKSFGARFQEEKPSASGLPRIQSARQWLNNASPETWQSIATQSGVRMSGDRLKKAWKIITGNHVLE